ncbi:MAG: hypothetical protein K0M45_01995 [Candidatus Paracaedibacteraceae bacterium]|nr:hypothetical protein [Candidatus Paracaedibacteraceae bacterium]
MEEGGQPGEADRKEWFNIQDSTQRENYKFFDDDKRIPEGTTDTFQVFEGAMYAENLKTFLERANIQGEYLINEMIEKEKALRESQADLAFKDNLAQFRFLALYQENETDSFSIPIYADQGEADAFYANGNLGSIISRFSHQVNGYPWFSKSNDNSIILVQRPSSTPEATEKTVELLQNLTHGPNCPSTISAEKLEYLRQKFKEFNDKRASIKEKSQESLKQYLLELDTPDENSESPFHERLKECLLELDMPDENSESAFYERLKECLLELAKPGKDSESAFYKRLKECLLELAKPDEDSESAFYGRLKKCLLELAKPGNESESAFRARLKQYLLELAKLGNESESDFFKKHKKIANIAKKYMKIANTAKKYMNKRKNYKKQIKNLLNEQGKPFIENFFNTNASIFENHINKMRFDLEGRFFEIEKKNHEINSKNQVDEHVRTHHPALLGEFKRLQEKSRNIQKNIATLKQELNTNSDNKKELHHYEEKRQRVSKAIAQLSQQKNEIEFTLSKEQRIISNIYEYLQLEYLLLIAKYIDICSPIDFNFGCSEQLLVDHLFRVNVNETVVCVTEKINGRVLDTLVLLIHSTMTPCKTCSLAIALEAVHNQGRIFNFFSLLKEDLGRDFKGIVVVSFSKGYSADNADKFYGFAFKWSDPIPQTPDFYWLVNCHTP